MVSNVTQPKKLNTDDLEDQEESTVSNDWRPQSKADKSNKAAPNVGVQRIHMQSTDVCPVSPAQPCR
jgi:hypothetical protein